MEILEERLGTSSTRRRVVKTGIKLGYTVPIVAASFKLSARGARAQEVSAEIAINQCGTNDCVCDESLSFHPVGGTRCCVSCNQGARGASTCGGSDNIPTGCPGGAQPYRQGQLTDPNDCSGPIICAVSDKGQLEQVSCTPVYTGSQDTCPEVHIVTF